MGAYPCLAFRQRLMAGRSANVTIRPIRNGDAQAVFDLQETLFGADPNRLSVLQYADVKPGGPVLVLVAETGGMLAGFVLLRDRASRPWTGIDFIGVMPGHAGQGIGGKLLEAARLVSPRPVLRLFVRPSNTRAVALYARLGFRHTGTRKGSYADGEDALVMMKWVWPANRKGRNWHDNPLP
jgi:[ribosomal protein S18]-alanine N-acetyltransferase